MAEDLSAPPLRICPEDISRIFGAEWQDVPADAKHILAERNLAYRRPSPAERDEIVLSILERLDRGEYWVSGQDKQEIWEGGWSENLREFLASGDLSRLWPKFLTGKKVLRLDGDWIIPEDSAFEFNLVDVYRRWAFQKFLGNCGEIFEFGCGSCQHLPVLAEMFPQVQIHGVDWAKSSVQIVEHLARARDWKLKGHQMNLFEPDNRMPLMSSSGVLTVGTLEQLGANFEPFLQFLLSKRPAVVVHFETLRELYDPARLADYLAIRYSEKRNYLVGYVPRLKALAAAGKIEILQMYRVRFGSKFHDSYSTLVWRPVNE